MVQHRIALFVDGANAYATARALGVELDFKLLLQWISQFGFIQQAYYYTALRIEEDGTNKLRPLLDHLDFNGWTTQVKESKTFTDAQGITKTKGNMDIEMACMALELAFHKAIDKFFLFTGDGDFRFLLESMNKYGVHTSVISTIRTSPRMCADELRRQANTFIDFADIASAISQPSRIQRKPIMRT